MLVNPQGNPSTRLRPNTLTESFHKFQPLFLFVFFQPVLLPKPPLPLLIPQSLNTTSPITQALNSTTKEGKATVVMKLVIRCFFGNSLFIQHLLIVEKQICIK